ncbi:hypothetical protein YC2023_019549 [Brassica napus]
MPPHVARQDTTLAGYFIPKEGSTISVYIIDPGPAYNGDKRCDRPGLKPGLNEKNGSNVADQAFRAKQEWIKQFKRGYSGSNGSKHMFEWKSG